MSALRDAFGLLRDGQIARYLLARTLAVLGWQVLAVVVGWHVYELTHDPLALGLVGLWGFVPFLAMVLYGGHVADRVDRRRVVQLAYVASLASVLALMVATVRGMHSPWPIYLAVAVFGLARAFWRPALQAMLPQVAGRERLPRAVALSTLLWQVTQVVGPVLGGLLYLGGPRLAYGVVAALFIATLSLVQGLRVARPAVAPAGEGAWRSVREGLGFVVRTRALLGSISLDLFAVLLGGAAALLPVFADQVLHAGPVGLGVLRAASGIGAALAGAWISMRPPTDNAGAWMFGGVAVFGACTVVFGLSHSFALSFIALALAGAGDMVSVYVRTILEQLATPDHLLGRVGAVNAMFIGASNELGEFESGVTAAWLGTVPSVVLGGVLTLVVTGCWAWWFPALRKLRHLR